MGLFKRLFRIEGPQPTVGLCPLCRQEVVDPPSWLKARFSARECYLNDEITLEEYIERVEREPLDS